MDKTKVKMFKALEKCSSDDETRYFMTSVYFSKEDEVYVATDGRILMTVIADYFGTMETSGYVSLAGDQVVPIKKDGQFPNWKRVVPDTNSMQSYEVEIHNKKNVTNGLFTSLLAKGFGIILNQEYVKCIPEGKYTIYLDKDNVNKALVFTSKIGQIVIAPMNPDIDDTFKGVSN